MLAQTAQSGIGRGDDRGHPLSRRVQRGLPGPGGLLGSQGLTQARRVLFAGAVTPTGFPGVGHEQHRPHDPVGERVGVPVGVIGLRTGEAVGPGLVGDERDGAVVAAERRAGQRQPAGRVVERLPDGVAPGPRVPTVVDFVEHHERLAVLGAHPVPGRVAGHLGVGHNDPVVVIGGLRVGVGELRVQGNPDPGGRLGPLDLEVFGRHDDRDGFDGALGHQLGDDPQRKRRLACTWGCDSQEIPRLGGQVFHQCAPLPAPQ